MARNSIPRRIDKKLDDLLREIAAKNKISIRKASEELADASNLKLKGSKFSRDITF